MVRRSRWMVVAAAAVLVTTETERLAKAQLSGPPEESAWEKQVRLEAAEEAAKIPGLPGGPRLTPGPTPEETYEVNLVHVRHVRIPGHYVHRTYVMAVEYWEGYRGKSKTALGVVSFYDAVDRHDLRERASRQVKLRLWIMAAGAALALGSTAYGWWAIEHHDNAKASLSFATLALGVLTVYIGNSIDPHPVSEAEARVMAAKYNERLRAHLGLPPLFETPTSSFGTSGPGSARTASQTRLTLVPSATDGGGALFAVGTF
jgi:hypothetical protein